MKWYLRFLNKKIIKTNTLSFRKQLILKKISIFKWEHQSFYVKKFYETLAPKLKKQFNFKKFRLNKYELFAFRKLINNFCSNGNFLKYFIIFSNVMSKIYYTLFIAEWRKFLNTEQENNILFFLKNLKINLLLNLATYLIYFIFTKNEILFFAKALKLKKRASKKKKQKYTLLFEYISPTKRVAKTLKFWKYYTNLTKKQSLEARLYSGLFKLIINYKNSILAQYRVRVIKMLIKKKKLEL